jgi:hypothetical protein
VALEKRPCGSTSGGEVATRTTWADGSFSFDVLKSSVDRNTNFRVRFVGAEGYKASEALQSVKV